MNLEKMLDILFTKCSDYKRTNEEILKGLEIPHTKLLKEYMTQIKNDPLLWFTSFPSEYTSLEAMAKPKSGILYLLEKNEEVRKELGDEFCESLSQIIHKTWKTNKTMLLKQRVLSKESTYHISDDINEPNNELIKLQEENKQLLGDISKYKLEQDKNRDIIEKLNQDKTSMSLDMDAIKIMFIEILEANDISEKSINLYKKLLSKW